jgi:hypothetical protein
MDWIAASGAAGGFNAGVQNLFRIKQAGIELKINREKLDTQNKIDTLRIKQMEHELDPETLDYQDKMRKINYATAKLNLEKAETAQKRAHTVANMTLSERAGELRSAQKEYGDAFEFEQGENGFVTMRSKKNQYGPTTESTIARNKAATMQSYVETADKLYPADDTGMRTDAVTQERNRFLSGMGVNLGTAVPAAAGVVKMVAPDGTPLNILAKNVDAAIARGAKRA